MMQERSVRVLAFISVCALFLALVAIMRLTMLAPAEATGRAGKPAVDSSDPTLEGNVVVINGQIYYCIKYTTVDRGGLWCDKR